MPVKMSVKTRTGNVTERIATSSRGMLRSRGSWKSFSRMKIDLKRAPLEQFLSGFLLVVKMSHWTPG